MDLYRTFIFVELQGIIVPQISLRGTPMYQLIYLSSATQPFTKEQLVALLTHSRTNNERDGLSGILLYKDGNIMQVLEGEREMVEKRFHRIEKDPRHKDVIMIESGEIPQRQFGDWSMGFRDLADPELQKLLGYSQYMDKSLSIGDFAEDQTAAKELLRLFASDGL